MPFPLSGQQRQLLTALAGIHNGKTDAQIIESLKKPYSYLTDGERAQVVRDAHIVNRQSGQVKVAADGEKLSDYITHNGQAPYYIASVVAHWKDKVGREQYRTVRVAIPKDATKGQIDELVREEIRLMLTTKKDKNDPFPTQSD